MAAQTYGANVSGLVAPATDENMLTWGTVSSKESPVHKQVTGTWADVCSMVTTHTVNPSKDGAGWVPALIEPGKRNNARAGAWCLMVMDIEGDTETTKDGLKRLTGDAAPPLDAVASEIELRGWSACLASSHSHEGPAVEGTLGPRYRIVFQVTRPVLAAEVEPLAKQLALTLGLGECLDKKCFDASRLFYLPRCPAERLSLADRAVTEGQPIDVEAMLEQSRQAATPPRPASKQKAMTSVIDAFNLAADGGRILERHGYIPCGSGRWMSPNSSSQMPGVHKLPDSERFFSHHGASDVLSGKHSHDAFSLYCVLAFDGDVTAAIKAAARDLGLDKQAPQAKPRAAPPVDAVSRPPDEPDDLPPGSELELSERLTAQAIGLLRWSDGLDWLANVGTHWMRDLMLSRYSKAKAVCRDAAATEPNPKVQAKICAASTVNAVLGLSRSDDGIVTPVDEWDKYQHILNTQGEAIDLQTGKPVSRDGLLMLKVAGAAPSNMKTPVWDKFITEIFAGDLATVEFMQRLAGYCLTGSISEQKIFFLHGSGSNGKSVFLDVLNDIAGAYGHTLPSSALMTQKNEGHRQRFAALMGKRLAISSEIEESAHWAEAQLKEMTGDKTLTANFMRQNDITFDVTHKHVIAGNSKPRLKGDDYAMARRMVLIPFTQRFEGANRDNNLSKKLRAEYPGILQWAIDGAVKWYASGLAIPAAVTTASHEYMSENNDIELWLAECCTRGPQFETTSTDAYASFSQFKANNGEHAGSIKNFSPRLERIFDKKKTRTVAKFWGFKVNECATFEEPSKYARASRGE